MWGGGWGGSGQCHKLLQSLALAVCGSLHRDGEGGAAGGGEKVKGPGREEGYRRVPPVGLCINALIGPPHILQ